jgi:hypothetical protein
MQRVASSPDLARLSPTARAVYARIAAGTYRIDYEGLAERLLSELRAAGVGARRRGH